MKQMEHTLQHFLTHARKHTQKNTAKRIMCKGKLLLRIDYLLTFEVGVSQPNLCPKAKIRKRTFKMLTATIIVARVQPGTSKGITDLLLPQPSSVLKRSAVPLVKALHSANPHDHAFSFLTFSPKKKSKKSQKTKITRQQSIKR